MSAPAATAGARVAVPARGELLDAGGVLADALAVAAEHASPNTRRAYTSAYRALIAFATVRVGGHTPGPGDIDRDLVLAFRDELHTRGARSSTISARLSAIRRLADALELDPRIQRIRTTGAEPGQVIALEAGQYERLLSAPDLRTTAGRRDRAIIRLAGDAGLRRSEIVRLTFDDIVEERQPDRHRRAVSPTRATATPHALVVRDSKGGRTGTIPLTATAFSDLQAWADRRPAAPTTTIFLALARNTATPGPLSPDAIADIVAKHAGAAGLPPALHAPHVLRHTFCTRLAEQGTDIDVIRALARHRDIRTTQRYIHTTHTRNRHAIDHTFTPTGPLRPAD